jgi:hypothetical protein
MWKLSPEGPSVASLLQDDREVLLDNRRDCVYGHKRNRACFDLYTIVILSPSVARAKDLLEIKQTNPI